MIIELKNGEVLIGRFIENLYPQTSLIISDDDGIIMQDNAGGSLFYLGFAEVVFIKNEDIKSFTPIKIN